MERGEFDDLPGAGKPIADLGEHHDPDWWIKKLVERENIAVLPPSVQLRKEDAELDDRLDKLTREDDVRRELEDFNERVVAARYRLPEGPPLVTMPRDVDADRAPPGPARARAPGAPARQRAGRSLRGRSHAATLVAADADALPRRGVSRGHDARWPRRARPPRGATGARSTTALAAVARRARRRRPGRCSARPPGGSGTRPTSMAVAEDVYQRLLDGRARTASGPPTRALRLALAWATRGDVQVALGLDEPGRAAARATCRPDPCTARPLYLARRPSTWT